MESSEHDPTAPAAVDIENVMQEVRREILGRRLPGQVALPDTTAALPRAYYEHLFRAGLAQSRLDVSVQVAPSRTPLVGPLIDRLRLKFHELIVYYMNLFVENQSKVNAHMLQALGMLGQPVSETDLASEHYAGGRASTEETDEWATPDDVYACYRLLLDREPDEHGWQYWSGLVTNERISRAYLVDSFVNGHEFRGKQAERQTPVLVELPEFKMYVRLNDQFIGAAIARDKQYEPHVTRALRDTLGRGATFIDVGANIGYFALLAAKIVGPSGRVLAFEPNPANCELLRRSIATNEFGNVTLHQQAVAESRQTLHFATAGIDSNGRVVNPAEAAAEVVALPTVEAVALDEALADRARIDVIKLDVEGAEARAWRGMQTILARHKPTLLFEFSPVLLRHTSEVEPEAFLRQVNDQYDLYIISPVGTTATRPDSVAEIIARQADSNQTHLDILARPRR
jgi:FkbM family methyltransferase